MAGVLSLFLVAVAGLLAIPAWLFCIEILAAILIPQRRAPANNGLRPRIAVLVPAHNESAGLADTLNDIRTQLRPGDRLLVVADNCTDDTAEVARATDAEVTERNDPVNIGKGYALAWGVQHLGTDPPAVTIVIDADCRLASDALTALAAVCAATDRPAQALYLMTTPGNSPIDHRVAAFAFRVKNWGRPLGLRALGLPCQLMGTGMAFPWKVISSAELASGAVVEDLKLGLDLAGSNHPAVFCPSALVTSEFPFSIKGARSQRQRWEHGHMGIIARNIPALIGKSLAARNLDLLALTLDAAVPPLTLFGMVLGVMVLITAVVVSVGFSPSALILSVISFVAYAAAVMLCWLKFGRDLLPLRSFLSIFSYVAAKLPIYRQFFASGADSRWVRTDRDKADDGRD